MVSNLRSKLYRTIICLSLIFLPACKKYSSRPELPPHREARILNEAKLVDVSLPVGVIAYDMSQPESSDQGSETIAFYETDFSEEMLREFYQLDMERLGWKQVDLFISLEETLILYENPRKIAVISIRPYRHHQGVVIFLGPRS